MRVLFHSMKDTQGRCVEEMELLKAEFHGIGNHLAREIEEVELPLQSHTGIHDNPATDASIPRRPENHEKQGVSEPMMPLNRIQYS